MKGFLEELKRRNVIRVAVFYAVGSWLVLQVADVLFGLIGVPEWSLRLVGGILLLGFPFALIVAWAFELTPEGLKREKDVDRSRPADAEAGRKLDIATIALLVVTLGILAFEHFSRAPDGASRPVAAGAASEGPRDLSIAVLPFVNMSGDTENEYFSDGLSEEVLNVLAKIEDFRVAGRTSSFAFKGQNQDLRAIGEKLDVVHILEGSVRKQGNRVRVTAQLIDARNGYHLWSDTYDRQLDDIFAIQDDIATEVVMALKTTLLAGDEQVIAGAARGDVEAYNHYLKGQFHTRLRTRDGLNRALEEFQRAILVDPDYAPPYAGMAMVYSLFDNYGYRSLDETGDLADRAIERALELAPDSDEAWAAKGLLISQREAKTPAGRAEAKAALDRALEINPNHALAHLWRANTVGLDFAAMRREIQRAYELDPLHPVILYRMVVGNPDPASAPAVEGWLDELRAVAPDWYMTWQAVADLAGNRGQVADQLMAVERITSLNPRYMPGFIQEARLLDMLGYRARAESVAARAAARFAHPAVGEIQAAMLARDALATRDFQSAADAYGRFVEPLEDPEPDWTANLSLLEVGAGRAESAERRMRALLDVQGPLEPESIRFDSLFAWYALATALKAQGRDADIRAVGEQVTGILDEAEAQGAKFSFIPFARGLVSYLNGDADGIERGVRDAINAGWRIGVQDIVWTMPTSADAPQLARALEEMEAALSRERARYEAAKAAETAAT